MYRITQALSVGKFATEARAGMLIAAGVTHLLNVSDSGNQLGPHDGFREVVWLPIDDFMRMPNATVIAALTTLHRLASEPEAHVYVHCIAGHMRSPTILWLYLIACGIPPRDAQEWIEERSPDAEPGHRKITSGEHVLLAQKHGLTHFFPLPRGEVVIPAPIPLGESLS